MLIGYNTNVPYKGKVYHVQTEDSGLANPCITTLLYHKGAILRSVKTDYAHILGSPDFEEKLKDMMKHQHREMIRDLIHGRCDAGDAEDSRVTQAGTEGVKDTLPEGIERKRVKSLDEILLEHISRKVRE